MIPRAVITGVGIIAPNGVGKDEYWKAVTGGESGIRKISRFSSGDYPSKVGGEVDAFDPTAYMERRKAKLLSRFAQFGLAATYMAVEDARWKTEDDDPTRIGISFGNTIGGKEVEEQQREYHRRCANGVEPFSAPQINSNFAVGVIATELGARGVNITISTGCTSALYALAAASDMIKLQRADVVIAGGSETPLVPFVFGAFCASGSLSRHTGSPMTASRPFEKRRDGFILAEGCGMLIVEELQHALKRGAPIYAEIAGYGVTNDAFSLIRMEPSGKEAANAMRLALKASGLTPGQVDYINAHGSSSLVADRRETNAIKQVFGEYSYRLAVSSIKSMIGQPLGAAGALQAATAALALRNGCIPPTINYDEEDPACDLDYTPNRARSRNIGAAMVNCFGLGGNNVSLVMKKYAEEAYQ